MIMILNHLGRILERRLAQRALVAFLRQQDIRGRIGILKEMEQEHLGILMSHILLMG